MTTILCKRTIDGLRPADDEAVEALRRIPVGNVVYVDFKRPRNLRNHNRWWALCQLLADTLEWIPSKEVADKLLKLKSGHVIVVADPKTGELLQWPDSISFKACDEDKFLAIWDRAVKYVCEELLPTVQVPELESEILSICGGGNWQA